jgi:hypothetical protein
VSRRNRRTSSRDDRRLRDGRSALSFRCLHCRLDIPMQAPGTAHRNHCPQCLYSRHVDERVPGDRRSDCGARMAPLTVAVRGEGEWILIHRCLGCGELRANRVAGDDSPLLLMRMAIEPLARPPFPLERLAEL